MNDRLWQWTGAGVLAAGLSTSMLLGAGVAIAAPDSSADKTKRSSQAAEGEGDDGADGVKDKDATQESADANTDSDVDGADGEGADSDDEDANGHDAEDGGKDGGEGADRKRKHDRAKVDNEKTAVRDEHTGVADGDDTADADVRVGGQNNPAAERQAARPDMTVAETTAVIETEDVAPTFKPDKPDVVDTIAGAVSSVIATLLSPLAGDGTTPEIPGSQAQMWTLAAASRREFENAFESPSPAADEAAPAENSLIYTPPPNLQDQITLLFYDGMKAVSQFTGISVTKVLGDFMASKNPPFFLTFGLKTARTTYTTEDGAQWDAWEISSGEPTDKTVVALHGGGWVYQPNLLNWIDYTTIPREIGAKVIVPLYPLATTEAGKATTVIPQTADVIGQIIEANGDPDNVSIYADSAGSSIAMSAVRELIRAGEPVPGHMVLLSLVADSSLQNPDIRDVDDPLFDVDNAAAVWQSHYYDGIKKTDPLVSPLFWDDGTLQKLPPTTVYVGEREILYPDTLLLHDRALDVDAPLSVVVGTGLPHDWPASGLPFIFSQTAAVHDDILRELGLAETKTKAAQPLSISLAEEALPKPGLINVIGSFFFNTFQAFEQAIAGQPQVPPGSTVRVQRSTLDIDCGPGYTVNADWYFPETAEPPTRLIYFQHGFPGSSAEYDYTAAELAERNQAIVVLPTISSNLFDCYGCQLGGDPMHAAVAKLFLGDREDLLASAKAAGFEGDALPERFVIAGHSGGGQLAGGAAGYYEEFAQESDDPEQAHNLVGVLLLDTSPVGGAIERAVAKIPEDIPVYTIAAAPSFLNSQGGVEKVLEAARPDSFVGVQLVGGTHGDSFQSHTALVQIGGWITSLGIPRAENIEAVQELTQGWINDWYEGTDTGVYGDLGTTVDVPDTGGAQAYVLPAPEHQWTVIDLVVELGLRSVLLTQVLETCAEDPSASAAAASCSAVPASVLATLGPRKLAV